MNEDVLYGSSTYVVLESWIIVILYANVRKYGVAGS